MRGELFPEREDELQDLIENSHIDTTNINKYISADVEMLQAHYTILLDYVETLEKRLKQERYKKQKVMTELQYLKKHGVVASKNENEIIMKQLKCSNASLKSVIVRKDKELEQIKLLLSESLKEIDNLKKFKQDVVKMLNNGG